MKRCLDTILRIISGCKSLPGWPPITEEEVAGGQLTPVELSGRGRRIKTTYQVVTPESAEHHDYADSGWEDEEGFSADPDELDVEEHGSESAAAIALAVDYLCTHGSSLEASDYPACCPGRTWYTETEGEKDYQDVGWISLNGSEKTLSFYLEGFTEDEERAIYAEIVGH